MRHAFVRNLFVTTMTLLLASIANAIVKEPITKPWLRLEGSVAHLRTSPKGNFLAFTDAKGQSLRVLELKSEKVVLVSKNTVGPAFFWSPDGARLFFRELYKNNSQQVISEIKAYDTAKLASIAIEKFPQLTGLLNFDPRDLRMHFLSAKGLHSKRLVFPDERLARWQIAQRTENGKWIVAQNGVMWATDGGYSMKRMDDDQSPIQAFDVSPDGSSIAWSTKAGFVYTSNDGRTTRTIGAGQDPRWHPFKSYLLYSAARRVGKAVVSYDLRIVDEHGNGKYVTNSQGIDERWATWNPDGNLIYFTKDSTTDLFKLDFSSL